MITQDTISNILSATRIEEVVGDFVALKRRGVNYIGLCPFHNEKTPSFTVSPSKGIYKCFGCGKAGNSVNFLMEHEHFTYPEALKFLARRYQIEIDEEEKTPEQVQEQNEKDALFQLNSFAQQFFEKNLFETEEGIAVGLSYLKKRGFREDIIRKFQVGYSPDKWEALVNYAQQNGYKSEFLVKTGLVVQRETRMTDRFHGRVIFPIHSASGRITGFGGRIMTDNKQVAKYINSPESDIYNKSKSLYGLFLAKNSIISHDNCYLVEGYTDVMSLYQAGIDNVVASSGTSLTQDQVKLIQRYTPNITILYDGDPAGIKASMRGIDMVLEQGMNVRIVLLPDGEDPDSFVRKNRVADVEKFIHDNAVNFILFKTRLLLDDTAGDPIKKSGLIKEIVNTISLIPDGISRSVYIKDCSSMMDVPEQTLVNEMNRVLRKRYTKKLHDQELEPPPAFEEPAVAAPRQIEYDLSSSEFQEKEIIRILLLFGNNTIPVEKTNDEGIQEKIEVKIADLIVNDILQDDLKFESTTCQQIFNEVNQLKKNDVIPDRAYFLNHPNTHIATLAIDLSIMPYELSQNWMKNSIYITPEVERLTDSVFSALYAFKAKKIDRMIEDNQKKLLTAKGADEAIPLLEEQIWLKDKSRQINLALGRIIIR